MQYSPPKIRYVPVVQTPTFAICELNGGVAGTGLIQLAQLPGKSVIVRSQFEADAPTDEEM